jgi:hypothetical protein
MIMRRNAMPTHTREDNDRRNAKILWIFAMIAVAITCYMIGDNSADMPTPGTKIEHTQSGDVPVCEIEDGSTQEVCWWRDDANGRYLNINYGQYVYVPMNDEMINWSE